METHTEEYRGSPVYQIAVLLRHAVEYVMLRCCVHRLDIKIIE
jgi:hypothetical protein